MCICVTPNNAHQLLDLNMASLQHIVLLQSDKVTLKCLREASAGRVRIHRVDDIVVSWFLPSLDLDQCSFHSRLIIVCTHLSIPIRLQQFIRVTFQCNLWNQLPFVVRVWVSVWWCANLDDSLLFCYNFILFQIICHIIWDSKLILFWLKFWWYYVGAFDNNSKISYPDAREGGTKNT